MSTFTGSPRHGSFPGIHSRKGNVVISLIRVSALELDLEVLVHITLLGKRRIRADLVKQRSACTVTIGTAGRSRDVSFKHVLFCEREQESVNNDQVRKFSFMSFRDGKMVEMVRYCTYEESQVRFENSSDERG